MKLKSIIAAGLIPLMFAHCSTFSTGDAALLVTPIAFVAASRTIDKADDKTLAITKIRKTAANIRLASVVIASGTVTKEQFIALVAQTDVDQDIAYLASYLFDIYIAKVKPVDTNKFAVAVKILHDLSVGLDDAAYLASSTK